MCENLLYIYFRSSFNMKYWFHNSCPYLLILYLLKTNYRNSPVEFMFVFNGIRHVRKPICDIVFCIQMFCVLCSKLVTSVL